MSTTQVRPTNTSAFFVQAALSFGASAIGLATGIAFLPVDSWTRAFLALGLLYVVTSAFTLAKCVRDRQEETTVSGRVDQARLDKLLAEHDPFKVENP
ncbi:YiaA/YiaB family inner membrane protein [Streptomonospora algeriensis]|uniref:YiaA/YiaB family inner membrane protein n=1 Tax=Streptomonospora algeriensis TaxID=995084 RepID=A0ABW3BMN1_9ACTN